MKKTNYQLLITNYLPLILALLVVGYWLLTSVTFAQTNTQIILTWQANNFYPADYQGKPLATPNTPITVSAEVVRDNKLIELSQATFRWYVDEKFIKGGAGLKEINFVVDKLAGDEHFVRTTIELPDKNLEASVSIPIAKYFSIIDRAFPNQSVNANSEVGLQAIPYFFNVGSLQNFVFSWHINDQRQKNAVGNQLILKIGNPQTASQRNLQIAVQTQNRNNPLEFSKDIMRLLIKGF